MSEKTTISSELAAAIEQSLSASELQGIVAGMLCLSQDKKIIVSQLSEQLPEEATSPLLIDFIEDTQRQLADTTLGFELLLPETEELAERAQALTQWTDGFIAGLITSGLHFDGENAEELKEIIADLSMISDIDSQEVSNNNEDETALFEIEDYLRVAAVTIYTDFLLTNKNIVSNSSTAYLQ